eukprot:CAMPEP_0173190568 /NCGR_PEP_ID=MMETSP1141-20130122/12416_1 /TAXON_ID=483371 /ORGANISM="non described non described, Strain CCMP2298" /LENGTH=117 /DNA_ID=CAMNT_0014114689 /DNA_START=59 /DNA_END=413 /DNA_ORIENTATION=+
MHVLQFSASLPRPPSPSPRRGTPSSSAVEEVAVRAAPGVGLGAKPLVRQAGTDMLVVVRNNVVHNKPTGKTHHHDGHLVPTTNLRGSLLLAVSAAHHAPAHHALGGAAKAAHAAGEV